ncbi:eCIS core domain-containing protein, partial [Nostoc sp.]
NEAFAQQQMEATGLSIQAKYGWITPEGPKRLTVLQAKMDGLLNSQLKHATRFGHNIANIPLRRPQTSTPIQAKLTIGEPGDKYEQEADETARQVVQKIHQPQSEKLQRESLSEEEDELQMKPERSIQRESLSLPAEEEELQMKPMVQRVAEGGMATSPDLETSILQAKGGGQSLADNIRQPMEQAFGADFSEVKTHTDSQADQLNQSIQAKAFTTGQDVFFRQGAYEPGSRGGQELLAHELTHVVQQSREKIQRVIGEGQEKNNTYYEYKDNLTEEEPITKKGTKRKRDVYETTEDGYTEFSLQENEKLSDWEINPGILKWEDKTLKVIQSFQLPVSCIEAAQHVIHYAGGSYPNFDPKQEEEKNEIVEFKQGQTVKSLKMGGKVEENEEGYWNTDIGELENYDFGEKGVNVNEGLFAIKIANNSTFHAVAVVGKNKKTQQIVVVERNAGMTSGNVNYLDSKWLCKVYNSPQDFHNTMGNGFLLGKIRKTK